MNPMNNERMDAQVLWIITPSGTVVGGYWESIEQEYSPGVNTGIGWNLAWKLGARSSITTATTVDSGERVEIHPEILRFFPTADAAEQALKQHRDTQAAKAEEARRRWDAERAEREAREITNLTGRTVTEIRMTKRELAFVFEDGDARTFEVLGDCCSFSEWHDFHHPERLLEGRPIIAVEQLETQEDEQEDELTQIYGYRFTTEHPTFGPVSSVVSFRNYSNGYYGGWCEPGEPITREELDTMPLVTGTVIEAKEAQIGRAT